MIVDSWLLVKLTIQNCLAVVFNLRSDVMIATKTLQNLWKNVDIDRKIAGTGFAK